VEEAFGHGTYEEAVSTYALPDTSARAELQSFWLQANRAAKARAGYVEPTPNEYEYVLALAEEAYEGARWQLDQEWSGYKCFLKAVLGIDWRSSPGWPLMRQAPTNGDWLLKDGRIDPDRLAQLWIMVQQVMDGTYDHHWRVFVKDEPHTVKKAREGRWRLIVAASLPVQIVWRMCFSEQNDLESGGFEELPSLQGMSFCKGGWKRFLYRCASQGVRSSIDKSSWDWFAPGWVFKADLELRIRLGFGLDDKWRRVASSLYEDAFCSAKLVFSSGGVYRQKFWGFMKSGCFNTISTNSHCQFFCHALAESRIGREPSVVLATGDDTVQAVAGVDYVAELEKAGCVVKEVANHVEFMGCSFEDGYPEPLYFAKHLVALPRVEAEHFEEALSMYCMLYAHSPRRFVWREVARLLNVRVVSEATAKCWMDNPLFGRSLIG
jgi:hypothetical protein